MRYLTDRNRVQGLGSAHQGVHHWWMQRLSSLALLQLTVAFIFPFGQALGQGHAAVVALYQHWGHAFVAALFITVGFWHLAQGLQVVIEDYVPAKAPRTVLLVLNTLGNWLFAAAGIFAVAKIAFSA